MVQASLTAGAVISRKIYEETFSFTDGSSWGPDITITYLSAGAVADVEGSYARLTMNKGLDGEFNPAYRISHGFIEFDFYLQADPADRDLYIWFRQGGEFPVAAEVYKSSTGLVAGMYYQYTSIDAYYTITSPQYSTWYHYKGYFNGLPGGLMAVKLWKVGDPEPADWQATGAISELATPILDPGDWFFLDISCSAPTAEVLRFDNLRITDNGAPYSTTSRAYVGAAAVILRNQLRSATADAAIYPRRFTSDAWIIGGRSGHSRFYDHYGTQPDTVVVIDGPVGKFPSGTDVHTVLLDIVSRITELEGGNHRVFSFGAGAFIQPCLRAGAIIQKTITKGNPPFDWDLAIYTDAVIVAGRTNQLFTADAAIITAPETTFSADAWFIDLVC
jgi:hypothetical protein